MNEWPQGFESRFFHPNEFDHPELMDPAFIEQLDILRGRCGFGIKITDDARTQEELEYLYRRDIESGKSWPKDSAHLYIKGSPVRAVDLRPSKPSESSDLILVHEITKMYLDKTWMYLGLIVESKHFHIDDCPKLKDRRPLLTIGESR